MEEKFKEMSEKERLEYVASLSKVAGMRGMVREDRVLTGQVIPKFLQLMYGWPETENLALCICMLPHDWKGHRHERAHTSWYVVDGVMMTDDTSSGWSDGQFVSVPEDKLHDAENMLQYLSNGLVEGHFLLDDKRHVKFRLSIRLTGNRDDDLDEFGGAMETMFEMLLPKVPFVMLACNEGLEEAKSRIRDRRKLMKLDGPQDLDKFMKTLRELTPDVMSQMPTFALRFLEGLIKIMRIPEGVDLMRKAQMLRDLGAGMSEQRAHRAQAADEEALDGHLPESVKNAGRDGVLTDLDEQFT